MGSFLLKEEEIEDEEPKKATSIESFIHLEQNPVRVSNVKVIVISTAAVVALLISAFIIFRSAPAPQPIVIIPEDTNVKERIVENREKHEDKKIYTYLQTIDNERIAASSFDRKTAPSAGDDSIDEIDTEFDKLDNSGRVQADPDGALATDNAKTNVLNTKAEDPRNADDSLIVAGKNDLTKQEQSSLEKIDDLIKSLVDRSAETTKFSDGNNKGSDVQTQPEARPEVRSETLTKAQYVTQPEAQMGVPQVNRANSVPVSNVRPATQMFDNAKLEQFIERSGGAYRINLGTFETHSDAMKSITKLHNDKTAGEYMKKIPYYIIAVDDEIGVVSYKVLLGGFKLKEQAIELARAILTLFSNASHL